MRGLKKGFSFLLVYDHTRCRGAILPLPSSYTFQSLIKGYQPETISKEKGALSSVNPNFLVIDYFRKPSDCRCFLAVSSRSGKD